MQIIEADLLTMPEGVLVHQVNCLGVMGAGIARQIASKWPHVEKDYLEFVKTYQSFGINPLGASLMVHAENSLYVANMFAQDRTGTDARQTHYGSFALCLGGLREDIRAFGLLYLPVYFPYMIGCGLGGGNWEVISELIDTFFPDAIICKLPGS